MTGVINALTVDVEDYFHVSAFAKDISINDWDGIPTRVEANTHRLLQLFAEKKVRGTFFVLGWVAERYPNLVREICDQGHELACHGMTHQLVYGQEPEVFREETLRSKKLLEDVSGVAVNGYRAASYSITQQSLWAIDTLIEAGFTYDSSIFPVRHDRYGIASAPKRPFTLRNSSGASIVEFPLSVAQIGPVRLPVAGGGYFRIFPYWLSRFGLRSVNRSDQTPFIFYLHPWEVDPDQPRIQSSWLSEFRHYRNLDKCEARLADLLGRFEFSTVQNVLDRYPQRSEVSTSELAGA